ncbi:MAG: twin-arginine translocase TatA/TatE family subunit [Streptosporangiales bacterium]|nr:twin-arginine translocase TatA/TatE family subunit [Streptosporangiales bacterium]MBO0890911.1 twin-arginine translocase TatA/TatE family subunit [Acidothermales bacterium]
MFTDVGWGEILVILVVAVVVFGPDKLPKLASDLAKGIRMVRGWAQRARSEFEDELPEEFRNIDIASLHPKTFVRKALLDDDDDPLGLNRERVTVNGSVNGADAASGAAEPPSLPPGDKAPYDPDAT